MTWKLCVFLALLPALLLAEREELFPSTPEQIATLSAEPSSLIAGLISPLSGMPVMHVNDLIVKGAQEIRLKRSYLPVSMPVHFSDAKEHQGEWDKKYFGEYMSKYYQGWQYAPHLTLLFYPRTKQVCVAEPSGIILSFQLLDSTAVLLSSPYGISNTADETPKGQYDLRNTRISYQEETKTILVYATDGTVRHYTQATALPDRLLYKLQKEILPSGKHLTYHYGKDKTIRIDSQDPQERYTYASLSIQGSAVDGVIHFTSSSGAKATYHYTPKTTEWKIREKGKHKQYRKMQMPPLLTSVSSPYFANESLNYCDRCLLANYVGRDNQFGIYNDGYGRKRHYRTQTLTLPVGEKDAFVPAYTFDYTPPLAGVSAGSTRVTKPDGSWILYDFSKELLPTRVQFFNPQNQLQREKRYLWTSNQWLESLEMYGNEHTLLYKKSYSYDNFGNPVIEQLTGDLTGNGNEETWTTRREFTKDGSNLLLREEEEGGKTTCYSYLPGTQLLSTLYIQDGQKTLQSRFFLYDDCYNLIESRIEDEISTQITRYILRLSPPYLHMPEWIIDSYENGDTLTLLKKRHLLYDFAGNVAQEEVYGADEKLAYTLFKTYDAQGNLLSETNPLGQKACYTYDAHGRRITATSFSKRLSTSYTYDLKGRQVALTEIADEGVHAYASTYDAQDRCLTQIDYLGSTTHYTYDPLTSKIIRKDLPSIDIEGQITPVTTYASYDALGNPLTKQDANGHCITYRYNAYGAPTEIHYPDGSTESFRYTKRGALATHKTQSGLVINYINDILNRPLSKTYTKEEELLAQESFTYSGFHLLTETDKEGQTKYHFYDGAGRKIREEFCGHETLYCYDALGQLASVEVGDLVTHYTRDLVGHILEERKMAPDGLLLYKIGYSYDADGNQTSVKRYICGKESIQHSYFDAWGRLVEEIDPYENSYTKRYEELSSKLRCYTIDPLLNTTIETYDAHKRLVKKERLDSKKKVVSSQEKIYDPHGNLITLKEHVHKDAVKLYTQPVFYTYTPMHQIKSCTRGATTHYSYFPSGKLQTKTLPDAIRLHYSYHPLGFLSRIDSFDDKVHHAFTYDLLGRLIYAKDEKQNLTIERRLDPFGNLVFESFPNGLWIEKCYDLNNRPAALILPEAMVLYTYDPLYLRAVTRCTRAGDILYTHTYTAYDWDGNLLLELPPGNLGYVSHMTNACGYKTSIHNSYFSQQCHLDTIGNRIEEISESTACSYGYDALSQLTLENNPYYTLSYAYDSHYNRLEMNGVPLFVNPLNQSSTHIYDINGRQTDMSSFTLTYDALDRLTSASTPTQEIQFTYDPLGRRLSKTLLEAGRAQEEHYLYDGNQEIAVFSSDKTSLALRILANEQPIAIELKKHLYIPFCDVNGTIRSLVDPETHQVVDHYAFSGFGQALAASFHLQNPWGFASAHLDPHLNCIFFGSRLYNPLEGCWLTPDPQEETNPYHYFFNNFFKQKKS